MIRIAPFLLLFTFPIFLLAQKPKLEVTKALVSFGFEKFEGQRAVKALIIHSTFNASYPSEANPDTFDVKGVIKQFKTYNVSAHYLIDRQGNIHQLVDDNNIAWHAGKSQLPDGTQGVNACSIGIEIMCTYTSGPNKSQYNSLRELITHLDSTYNFQYILGHSEIAPGRKTDPWNFKDQGFYRK
ncbi:MAG: N-acetylmuramoyl-L-alanine amidase [Bacteroidota bacterium]|jgi:N-acetyl-anhydromuramyl-L-alanine amidase AmpD